jgi:formylglycine-generating enzyme required for sulfatase activity
LLLDFGDCPTWYTVLEQTPNASVVPDATLRAAITATNLPWRVTDNGTGIEMVLIPPGTYTMGCSRSNAYSCYSDESPTHQVTLTNAFYLSRTEVTQAQWVAKMGSNPSYFKSASSAVPASEVPNRPVEQVSWNDIQPFCTNNGLRLPTEAEWEYAYRAGTTTAFHGMPGYLNGTNDDNQLGTIAWFTSNSGRQTRPVAGKAANGFGLYDMAGNVWEWCQDWYGTYASGAQTNPTGPGSGSYRVLRGGSWGLSSIGCRASGRSGGYAPDDRNIFIGFRVARTP